MAVERKSASPDLFPADDDARSTSHTLPVVAGRDQLERFTAAIGVLKVEARRARIASDTYERLSHGAHRDAAARTLKSDFDDPA